MPIPRKLPFVARAGQTTVLILFGMSNHENMRFGKINATLAEIEQAAREANAHNFIMQLPNKYETLVSERGIQLSSGEKQRIYN
ncbi:unnamed protein product [Rotaria sp. Silwood1]|nr:unnamed protein product [Rotaria sp. Silwood1]